MGSSVDSTGVRFWRWLLPALCGLALLSTLFNVAGPLGIFGKPWFGYWDSLTMPSGQPFVAQIAQSVPGGATVRAGIRDGDQIDLRDVASYDRAALVFNRWPQSRFGSWFIVAPAYFRQPSKHPPFTREIRFRRLSPTLYS